MKAIIYINNERIASYERKSDESEEEFLFKLEIYKNHHLCEAYKKLAGSVIVSVEYA